MIDVFVRMATTPVLAGVVAESVRSSAGEPLEDELAA